MHIFEGVMQSFLNGVSRLKMLVEKKAVKLVGEKEIRVQAPNMLSCYERAASIGVVCGLLLSHLH